MASHTPTELKLAAGVLGRAARAVGLDPAQMPAPSPERVDVAAEELDEYVQPLDIAYERDALAATAPSAPAASAPFDFERDVSSARAA